MTEHNYSEIVNEILPVGLTSVIIVLKLQKKKKKSKLIFIKLLIAFGLNDVIHFTLVHLKLGTWDVASMEYHGIRCI